MKKTIYIFISFLVFISILTYSCIQQINDKDYENQTENNITNINKAFERKFDSINDIDLKKEHEYLTNPKNLFHKPIKRWDDTIVLITTSRLPQTKNLIYTIKNYSKVLLTKRIRVLYVVLDSEYCEKYYGSKLTISDSVEDWKNTQDVIKAIYAKTKASYFLILGSERTILRPLYNHTTIEDPPFNAFVPSDSWYIDFDDDYITDEGLVISRLPGLEGETASIISALQTAIKLHNLGGHISNSQIIFGGDDYPAPPYYLSDADTKAKQIFINNINTSDEIFFLGHGSRTYVTNWDKTHTIISYEDILYDNYFNFNIHNPIIYCWTPCDTGALGTHPWTNIETETINLAFMSKGAGAFIGKSMSLGMVGNMDVNFHKLFDDGARIGDAFYEAMRIAALDPDPDHDFFKFMAAGFQLYGDPLLRKYFILNTDIKLKEYPVP